MASRIEAARELMDGFAPRTGVDDSAGEVRRYLWTDAFAVCNYLALHESEALGEEGEEGDPLDRALGLIAQVHRILGRHREDDPRSGWISGLGEEKGARHPTAGGLRIGKPLPERRPEEPLDPRLEWDRDGQYFHYLTRWMHALLRVHQATGDVEPLRWARELARAAHRAFTYRPGPGAAARMYWKMSIDLSRPMVESMGAHDPLDGLVTLRMLQEASASDLPRNVDAGPGLKAEVEELRSMCEGRSWATDDPLGIGGLLIDLYRLTVLAAGDDERSALLAAEVAADAVRSLEVYRRSPELGRPAPQRLAFRELGLAIGLAAVPAVRTAVEDEAGALTASPDLAPRIRTLERHAPLGDAITDFWLDPAHRGVESWTAHRDINEVMLATSLVPEGYLGSDLL